jgi:Glycosyltransferase like family 2
MPPAVLAVINSSSAAAKSQNFVFRFLFIFRYLRLIVHIISYLFIYKATPAPCQPTYTRSDCTVILPTVDPLNEDFNECLHSISMNSPAAVIIVTVGKENERACMSVIDRLQLCYPATKLTVLTTEIASKRRQVGAAIPLVTTRICVLADDHVFWPSLNFLPIVLAPFEDAHVGCVGMAKKVRRSPTGLSFRNFFNFLGCVYLERHNSELAATNAIDGGVFVSGRTSVIRTEIVQDPAFMEGFTNERFFFGKFGPLNADDDNFITRWLVTNHWKIKFQHCKDATIETTLGTYPKFLSQCLRWVRTTWRSNSASLFTDGTVWTTQPWCVYAVYITSFFNFALFYDAVLVYTLYFHTGFGGNTEALKIMILWIFASKMVKLIPHFVRCPQDLIYIPGYIVFAYFHSLLKLYAGFTFFVTAWGGRDLAAVGNDDEIEDAASIVKAEIDNEFRAVEQPARSPRHVSFKEEDAVDIYKHHLERGSQYRYEPSSTASTSNWVHSSPRSTEKNVIETPWGLVRRNNPGFQPANVLEGQIPLRTLRKKAKKVSSSRSFSSSSSGSSSGSSFSSWSPRSGAPSPELHVCSDEMASLGSIITLSLDARGDVKDPMTEFCRARLAQREAETGTEARVKIPPRSSSRHAQSTAKAHSRVSKKSLPSQDEIPKPSSKKVNASKPKSRSESPSRSWNRGVDCGRQHDGQCMLDHRGRCKIMDVRDVQWNGR